MPRTRQTWRRIAGNHEERDAALNGPPVVEVLSLVILPEPGRSTGFVRAVNVRREDGSSMYMAPEVCVLCNLEAYLRYVYRTNVDFDTWIAPVLRVFTRYGIALRRHHGERVSTITPVPRQGQR